MSLSVPRRLKLAGLLAFTVAAATLVTAPASSAGTSCPGAPAVFPVRKLREGMMGTGFTVVKGREPVAFDVEILGVLKNGIAPGIDFILVQVSGEVIEETGGIAAGFSGSPVYIRGKLVGAIAYGFFAADQTVGGVTPAEPMLSVLGYPTGDRAAEATARPSREVRMDAELHRRAARASGTSTKSFPSSARQLAVPVAVSGLNARAMDRLADVIAEKELPFIPYRSGSAATGGGGVSPPLQPGDAVAASISLGDLTFAGVGTLTAVCENLGVAFGHPFFFDGGTLMGMHGANVLTVVRDPSSIFGPFKIATVEELHGIVDQDRLAAIRTVEGPLPAMVPVSSLVSNPDLGTSRVGTTQVIKHDSNFFPLLPFLAAFHLLLNQDVVFDRIGDGTATLTSTIEGIGPSGRPFRLNRTNMHFSEFDVSFESIFELLANLVAIQENRFGDVTFTRVAARSRITQEHLVATIERVLSASSLQPRLKERDSLRVVPGDTVRLQVHLRPAGSSEVGMVDLALSVPADAESGGVVVVRGGGADECFFCFENGGPEEGGEQPKTFEQLIKNLANAERNNELIATLSVDSGGDEEEPSPESAGSDKVVVRQDRVVRGFEEIFLQVRGSPEG